MQRKKTPDSEKTCKYTKGEKKKTTKNQLNGVVLINTLQPN